MNGKELLDRVNNIKNSGTVDSERQRATISGAVVGMIAGIYVAYAKKQNMLIAGALGAIGGAIIARLLLPKD